MCSPGLPLFSLSFSPSFYWAAALSNNFSFEFLMEDPIADAAIVEQVYSIVRAIPHGRVMSYGAVGAQCDPPISGYICGRIMRMASDDVPWWRVVGKNGALPITKRHPELAQE